MNEDQYYNYKDQLDLEGLKQMIFAYKSLRKREDKKAYLVDNQLSFIKYFVNFENNKLIIPSNKIKLIDSYDDCIDNINNHKKFFILSQTNIKTNKENLIHHFQYNNNEHYIYFKDAQKIFKVIKGKKDNNLFELELYIKKSDKNEYLNNLKKIMDENNNSQFLTSHYIIKSLKEFYLINNKWYDSVKKEGNKIEKYKKNENFKPKYENKGVGDNFPVEFNLVLKDENSESIIKNLINFFNIKDEIITKKIFIIKEKKEKNSTKENTYVCMISGNFIYFYLMKNSNYYIQFLIRYNDKNIMETEIKEKILNTSLKHYINFMIIFMNKQPKLYDIEFKEIGQIYNSENKDFLILESSKYPQAIEVDNQEDININKIQSLLLCLANIREIKDFINSKPNKIKNDYPFLFNFFQILRIMWKFDSKFIGIYAKDYESIFFNLLFQIRDLSKSQINIDIFDDIKILLEKVILNLQNDLYKLEKGKDFNYKDEIFQSEKQLNNLNEKTTFLQDLFFFKIELIQTLDKQEGKGYYQKYYLEFDINEEYKKSFDILYLFDKLNETNGKINIINRKLISLPKYLIIIINNNKKINFKLFPKNIMDIEKFCKENINKTKYEFICFIDINSTTFFKSIINSKWYKYDGKINVINNINNGIEFQNGSNFVIYKQI